MSAIPYFSEIGSMLGGLRGTPGTNLTSAYDNSVNIVGSPPPFNVSSLIQRVIEGPPERGGAYNGVGSIGNGSGRVHATNVDDTLQNRVSDGNEIPMVLVLGVAALGLVLLVKK